MDPISAHYLEMQVAIREAKSEIQQVIALVPVYAPQGWWREVDSLLSLALELLAVSRGEYGEWLKIQPLQGGE